MQDQRANQKTGSWGDVNQKPEEFPGELGIVQEKLGSKPKDRAQGAKALRDHVVVGRKFPVWEEECH